MRKTLFGITTLLLIAWLFYPHQLWSFLSWEKFRTLELMLSFATALGVFLAWYQFSQSKKRQALIDESSVGINIPVDQVGFQGVFSVINYGEISHQVIVQKAILNDGLDSRFELRNSNPEYSEVFSGLIKPKQSIDLHFFDVSLEDIFQFKGGIKLIIDGAFTTITEVRYVGDAGAFIVSEFPKLHPTRRWVISLASIIVVKRLKISNNRAYI